MSSEQPDGVGYAEQEQAVRALSEHYTAGRLDADGFDERVRRARASTTRAELDAVFSDLPEPPAAGGPAGSDDPTRHTAAPGGDPPTVSVPRQPGDVAGAPPPVAGGQPFPAGTPPYPGPSYPDTERYPDGEPYPGTQPYPGPYHADTQPYSGTQPYPGNQPYSGTQPYPTGLQYPGAQQHYGTPPPYAGEYPPADGAGYPGGPYDPRAPYGWEPFSGRPYSDKQKIVAGLLQVFLPFGVGRFYTGHVGLGVAQILVTFVTLGVGAIWGFVDGIVILAGSPTDPQGRPLRP